MSVLFVLLPVALALGGGALLACIWAIRRGQFDDLQSPAVRILLDDRPIPSKQPDGSELSKEVAVNDPSTD
jgi:cbb3-type cytochrome oxidase maturation protein